LVTPAFVNGTYPLTTRTGERALQVQRELAAGTPGSHRRPAADFLIAAVAEEGGADVSLWFFDNDLQVICEHTGQPYQAEAQP
jgi:predicted nucleic acid-binding protein